MNPQPAEVPDFSSSYSGSHRPFHYPDRARWIAMSGLFALCLLFFAVSSTRVWSQSQVPVTTVSAANFRAPVAPNSIVASFGTQLATGVKVADTVPLPTQLLGTVVTIRDARGASQTASLIFVSPLQINYIVPEGAAAGPATVIIRSGDGKSSEGPVQIATVAPAIFTANQDGKGVPAGDVLRVLANGAQSTESPSIVGPDQHFIPRSISLGPTSEKVYLILFLTGVRGTPNTDGNRENGSAENVTVLTGGVAQTPLYAGPQGSFAGLDQINLEVPRTLLDATIPGSKQIAISVKVAGFSDSNSVEIALAPPEGAASLQITGVTAPDRLLANSVIVLSGNGISALPDKNKISFGEGTGDPRPGEVRTASASQISALVPFGALTGSIALNSDGKRWTSSSPFTVRTSFSAVIKDTEGQLLPPVVGARVCFPNCAAPGALTTTLQPGGWFVLPDTPAGIRRVFVIEPVSQNSQLPFNRTLISSQILADRDNHLPQDIFLQAIYGPSGVVGTGNGLAQGAVTSSVPNIGPPLALSIEGFRFSVPAGADATFLSGAKTGALTLTPVKNSLTPVPLPQGVFSSAIVQISPFGVKLNPGGKLVFPNLDNLNAARLPSLFKYDLNSVSFVDTGIKGAISDDGRSIETPAGAITEASIYFVSVPQLTTTVAGRVLDSDGVTPIRGAVVRANGRQTSTDGNGGFSLQDVAIHTSGTRSDVRSSSRGTASVKQGGISVIASFLRPSGRTDTATGETMSANAGGITNLPPLSLSGATSNRPPTILVPGNITVYVTQTSDTSVLVTDPDPGQAIASLTAMGASFASILTNGGGSYTLRLAPGNGNAGSYTLTLEARDVAGAAASVDVTVVVLPLPIANPLTIATNEDTPRAFSLTGSDAGSSTLTFTLAGPPAHGSLTGSPPNLLYSPFENFNGDDSFSFRVSNGTVSSAPATVSIKVDPVNDAPVMNFGCVNGPTLIVGQKLECFAFVSDVDGTQGLVLSAENLPSGADFNTVTGAFEWMPTPAQTGFFEMRFLVTDSGSPPLSDTKYFTAEVVNPLPVMTAIMPTATLVATPGLVLTVTGSGFIPGSVVRWNGSPRVTAFVNSGKLTASILPGDLTSAGLVNVTVFNPLPGGGTSAAAVFTINNPIPALSSILPIGAFAGGSAFVLTVNGSNFVSSSMVRFNGLIRTTTFVNSMQLTAAITASDIMSPGIAVTVDVFNPAPGGGSTGFNLFSILDPAPVITSTIPVSAVAGGGGFVLEVSGSNFISFPPSIVRWGGSDRPTTYVNGVLVRADISASDIADGGIVNLTVFNPGPALVSAPFPFTVNNPVPAPAAPMPNNTLTGSGTLDVDIPGSGFVPSSVVRWNGSPRPTTFLGSMLIRVTIPASDFVLGAVANLSVFNPSPGGGSSPPVQFTVVNPPPHPSSNSSPNSAFVGAGDTMIQLVGAAQLGSAFVPNSVVRFNGSPVVTTYLSPLNLTAVLPASHLSTAVLGNLTVFNPPPGGGTSLTTNFFVVNPVPVTLNLSPSVTAVGGGQFVLTVNGSGFVSTSTVEWNASARPTTFVNPGQLTALISAADIQNVGSANITVTTPEPYPGGGGGTSAPPLLFAIQNPVPMISSFSPPNILVGGEPFVLVVNGSNFVPTSVVKWGGSDRTTAFVNAGQLTALISTEDIAMVGPVSVSVTSPPPGGGTSVAVPAFLVLNPLPVPTSVEPTAVIAGSGGITLNVYGTGFVPASTVFFNFGPDRPTTFVDATNVQTNVLAAELAVAAVIDVRVGSPYGGVGPPVVFTINNPQPSIEGQLSPPILVGSPAADLVVTGAGFVSTSVGRLDGSARPTVVMNSTQLTISLPATDFATTGIKFVTIFNPAPGGGTSNANDIEVRNPTPVLNSIAPDTVPINGPDLVLTANGSAFVEGIVLKWDGSPRVTTFVNSTQVTAVIPAADTLMSVNRAVTVTNPMPGGGDSNALNFFVSGGGFSPPGPEEFSSTWTLTGPLNVPRNGLTATQLGRGGVLVAGGRSYSATGEPGLATSAAEVFDQLSGLWRRATDMLLSRVGHSATFVPLPSSNAGNSASHEGFVLVVGGEGAEDQPAARTAEAFDPVGGRWREISPPLFAHVRHTATLLADGRVLISGGENETSSVTASSELFDPQTGSWVATSSLSTPRSEHSAVLLQDGRVVVVGGLSAGSPVASVEIYDPATGLWTQTAPLNIARSGHSATLLPNGQVFVVGGASKHALSTAEMFDPATATWSLAGRLSTGRFGHSATVLPDGSVLVGGGQTLDGQVLFSCEKFDSVQGGWSDAPALNHARTGHAALVLEDGRIVVVGGRGGVERPQREVASPAGPLPRPQR